LNRKVLTSELPVTRGNLTGRADLIAQPEGKPWVIEIKTTQSRYALAPSPEELYQLSLYADLLDFKNPVIACLRINFRRGKVGVFYIQQSEQIIQNLKESVKALSLVA